MRKIIAVSAAVTAVLAFCWFTEWQPVARECRAKGGNYFLMPGECVKFVAVPIN